MSLIDLPLFPLNVVLMPEMSLPLHIFEPRYREMVANCLATDARFGVLLEPARRGGTDPSTTPVEIGTVAEIMETSRLKDGRMNIVAEGRQRFRVRERCFDRSYLHGVVEILAEPVGDEQTAPLLAATCSSSIKRYIQLLLKQIDQEPLDVDLPMAPVDLSYRVANIIQQLQPSAPAILQAVLEAETAEVRLQLELSIIQREYAILAYMADLGTSKNRPYANPN
jgi:Lon protease-like protein